MLELHCHPATPCPINLSLHANATRQPDGSLRLCYHLHGDVAQVRIPPAQPPQFTDNLWEHTCLEAFVGVTGDSAYREFNLAPSTQWAAYAFSNYRQRVAWMGGKSPSVPLLQRGKLDGTWQQQSALQLSSPPLQKEGLGEDFLLTAIIPPANLPAATPWQLNLTAVIELLDGSKCYWALKHPSERPDFHHRDGFTHEIWP